MIHTGKMGMMAMGAAAGYFLYEPNLHGAFMGAAAVCVAQTLMG